MVDFEKRIFLLLARRTSTTTTPTHACTAHRGSVCAARKAPRHPYVEAHHQHHHHPRYSCCHKSAVSRAHTLLEEILAKSFHADKEIGWPLIPHNNQTVIHPFSPLGQGQIREDKSTSNLVVVDKRYALSWSLSLSIKRD